MSISNITPESGSVKPDIQESIQSSSLIEININREIYSHDKKQLKRLAGLKNNPSNWTIEKLSIQEIAKVLSEGYTVRPGIKIGGNTIENVQRASVLLLDFDNQSVQETLAVAWTKNAAILYFTPSYEPGVNEKHRLLFRLSRPVSPAEYEHIYKYLLNFYKKADRLYSAGSLFFGASNHPESVSILNESGVLEVSPFLGMDVDGTTEVDTVIEDSSPPPPPDTSLSSISKREGARAAALKWIAKEVWLKACANDIDKFYCLHSHRFTHQGKDNLNLAKWGGHRPEDTSKTTGTGFFTYWQNPELPPAFINQGSGGLDKGTFIDYWHHYKIKLYGKEWESIKWQQDQKYVNFKIVCDDIAEHFGVQPFDFNAYKTKRAEVREQNQDLINQVKGCLRDYVYLIKSGGKDSYINYDFRAGIWRVKPEEYQVYRDCIKPYLISQCDVPVETLDEIKVSTMIEHLVKRFDEYKIVENKIQFDLLRNVNVIPTSNGDYNWKTKEFIQEFDPHLHNTHRSLHNFDSSPPDTPGVKLLSYWLDEMNYSDSQKKAIKSWLIVNTLGIATRTNRMLNIFGTPETGKSVIGQIIRGVVGESLSYTARGKQLTDGRNRFSNQSLDGIYSLFIDEFKADAEGWESLKMLVGKAGSSIEVEKKGMQPYNVINIAGITTATQDGFFIPNSDDGGIKRRICMIRHRPEQHNPKLAHIDRDFDKPGIYRDIWNWCIQQDGDAAVEDFVEYAKSEEATAIKAEVLYQNDPILQFMEEIEITNDPEDVVSRIELQSAYSRFLEVELGVPSDKQRVDRVETYLRGKIASNSIKWDFDDTTKVTINKKQMRGMKGVKMRILPDIMI